MTDILLPGLVAVLSGGVTLLAVVLAGVPAARLVAARGPLAEPCLLPALGMLMLGAVGLVLAVTGLTVLAPLPVLALALWGLRDLRRRGVAGPVAAPLALALAAFAVQGLLLAAAVSGGGLSGDMATKVFRFTGVTPGDAPVVYHQAQYLVNAVDPARHLHGFTLTDRPVGGGLITLTLMGAVGLSAVEVGADIPWLHQAVYAGIWMALNGLGAVAVYRLALWFCGPRAATLLAVLALVSPFFVVMAAGLWPKLAAFYMAVMAIVAAAGRRPGLGGALAGAAFLVHGSFLWFALLLWGCLALHALRPGVVPGRWGGLARLSAGTLLPVAGWFAYTASTGVASPLSFYYLYNAGVTAAIDTPVEAIKAAYYAQVNRENLSVLGVVNVLRNLLPGPLTEALRQPVVFGPDFALSALADRVVLTYWYHTPYVLGFPALAVMVFGAVSGWSRDWRVSLALVVLLAGFVPGLLLYRREGYPSLHVMMYALVPLVVFAASGLDRLRAGGLRLLAGASLAEFAFVWLFRAHLPWAPPPESPYRESPLYLAVVAVVLGGALAAALLLTRTPDARPAEDPGAREPAGRLGA